MDKKPPELYTLSQISENLGIDRDRLDFAVRSRDIAEQYRVAEVRMWDEAGVKRILDAVAETTSAGKHRQAARKFMSPEDLAKYDDRTTPHEERIALVLKANERVHEVGRGAE